MPIALVSFIDAHRQWYKARLGLEGVEAAKKDTFCRYVVTQGRPLIVPDATQDSRFVNNPFVVGEPHIRSYAGVPITIRGGHHIGSLCIIDFNARSFSDEDATMLYDLADIVAHELELRRQASFDGLTGVHTRRAFMEEAGRVVALALRHHDALALVMMDIDHFKAVNDRYGHPAGDRVLAAMTRTCGEHLRESDVMGRLGGEEFAVLLPHTPQSGAKRVAEKLRSALEETPCFDGRLALRITASFGVSALTPACRDLPALLAAADKALYEAKSSGRNRVVEAAAAVRSGSSQQRRVLKAGQIVFNGGMSSVDCTIRSQSEEGAGIDVSSMAGLPSRFTLVIKADSSERPVRVAASSDRHLDVRFE